MLPSLLARRVRGRCTAALILFTLSLTAYASAAPQRGPELPRARAIRDVRLSPDEASPRQTIVLMDGRIEAILDVAAELPPGARVIEGEGHYALPAFLDAWTLAGCEAASPDAEQDVPIDVSAGIRLEMRAANRKGIQPAFRAVDVFALEGPAAKSLRKAGFGAVCSAPSGEILAGSSVLATTRSAAHRDIIVRGDVFDHAAFRASGSGYPSTLMAYHAQLRQFFWDAERHGTLQQREADGKPGGRPVYDEELEAGLRMLSGARRLVCEASSARDIRRWIRLSDEFGFKLTIAGGSEAWKVADVLASRGVPVLLTLDWGDEVDDPDAEEDGDEDADADEDADGDEGADGDEDADEDAAADEDADAGPSFEYTEPLGVRREKRRLWVEKRDNALRLHEAGVRLAFVTGGGKASDLLESVRAVVEHGFPADVARAALTRTAAELCGVERTLGRLEPGYAASIALWTGDPTGEKAELRRLLVDGYDHEYEIKQKGGGEGPADGLDLSGSWSIEVDDEERDEPSVAVLTMAPDGTLTGVIKVSSPLDDSIVEGEIEGTVSGRSVDFTAKLDFSGFAINVSFEGEVDEDNDNFSGKSSVSGPGFESSDAYKAERKPDGAELKIGVWRTLCDHIGCNHDHDHPDDGGN